MKKILLPAALLGVLTASGCATVMNEDTQSINVRTSNNSKITTSIDGRPVDIPASISVRRANKDLVIYTTAENCVRETRIGTSVDSVFFVNMLSGGSSGSTTDYASSNMWEYDSDVMVNCID
jgi:outer membrane murein-binding lipoprotein Lpp